MPYLHKCFAVVRLQIGDMLYRGLCVSFVFLCDMIWFGLMFDATFHLCCSMIMYHPPMLRIRWTLRHIKWYHMKSMLLFLTQVSSTRIEVQKFVNEWFWFVKCSVFSVSNGRILILFSVFLPNYLTHHILLCVLQVLITPWMRERLLFPTLPLLLLHHKPRKLITKLPPIGAGPLLNSLFAFPIICIIKPTSKL